MTVADVVLSAPPETGIRDIILRISGAPLYTPTVHDRNVFAQDGVVVMTSQSTAVARTVADDSPTTDTTTYDVVFRRTAYDAVPATADWLDAQALFNRLPTEPAPMAATAVRVTVVSRDGVQQQVLTDSSLPSVLHTRFSNDLCVELSDSADRALVLPRDAAAVVPLDADAVRVAQVTRDFLEHVGLTDATQAIRVFPRAAAVLDAVSDSTARQTLVDRQARVLLALVAVADRTAAVLYVPGGSGELGALPATAGAALDGTGLSATDARGALDPELGGTVGPAAVMMGEYALALLDAIPEMQEG